MQETGSVNNLRIAFLCDLGHASPRVIGLASGLSNLGHDVSVFTPSMSNRQKLFFGLPASPRWKLIETKRFPMQYRRFPGHLRIYRKIMEICFAQLHRFMIYTLKRNSRGVSVRSHWDDEHISWFGALYPIFKSAHSKQPFDFIVSSSSPFSTHIIAKEFSVEFGIQWVADYRDLWSQNYVQVKSVPIDQIDFEKEILATSSGATTVSSETKFLLANICDSPIEVLYNGFESQQQYRPIPINTEFRILYVGGLYLKNQNLDSFIEVVLDHNSNSNNLVKVKLQFMGDSAITVLKYFKSQNKVLPEWIQLIKTVTRNESINLQSSADALLMLEWSDSQHKGILRTKMFEYLSTGKPIISYGGFFDESYVIQKDAGLSIFLGNVPEAKEFFSQLRVGKLLNLHPNIEYISQFSYLSQAKRLANFLFRIRENKSL